MLLPRLLIRLRVTPLLLETPLALRPPNRRKRRKHVVTWMMSVSYTFRTTSGGTAGARTGPVQLRDFWAR